VRTPRIHPRPQLVRPGWTSLDGSWDFALDPDGRWQRPDEVRFDRAIEVPFAPESARSGIRETGFFGACWYRRRIERPALDPGQRVVLRFGAVDYHARVWVQGAFAGEHDGGYTPFAIDCTDLLRGRGPQEIVVCAEDDPHDLSKPRGKQDWLREPHSIWYPRTTGIWQTVWLETLPPCWIAGLRWTPNLERWELGLEIWIGGRLQRDLRLRVAVSVGNLLLADDSYAVTGSELSRRIALSDPGIDDYRNEFLWSPASPTLFDVRLELVAGRRTLDVVQSYTALRTIGVQNERVVLNGRPLELRMVLDQGYWPRTGLTPPDDLALRRDVTLIKAMGFNGVRKHQKIEDPRFLYWCDRLGLLVWEEMPSAYRFTHAAVERTTRQWIDVLRRDWSHPCIVGWVPFNESWGVPNLPEIPAERHFVHGLYHLTKTIDPTRPVVGNDGWESIATDIIGIHDYDDDPSRLRRRYAADEELPKLFRRERPGGRRLMLEGDPDAGQPVMLTEFGGIAYSRDRARTWGYSRASSPRTLAKRYAELLEVVRNSPILSGFCYTQFTDTWQEVNGLLYADRRPKFPIAEIRAATGGPRRRRDAVIEREWRERMRRFRRTYHLPSPGDSAGD
jgi:hypothetical protein